MRRAGVPFVFQVDQRITVRVDLEPYMAVAIADALERDGCESEADDFRDAARECAALREGIQP